MKLKDLIEQYGDYEVIDTVDTEIHKGNSKNDGINVYLRKPKPKTIWDLKDGDVYFFIATNGDAKGYEWYDYYRDEREVGNVFLTKEEAEKDVERRKVETLLLKYGGRRWFNETSENYYIYYDLDVIDCTNTYEIHYQGSIYFDTEEQAEKAIDEIGEERIKKALFEVR